jgi:hypothetical protein
LKTPLKVVAVLVTVAIMAGACSITIGSSKPAPVYIVTTTTTTPVICPKGTTAQGGNCVCHGPSAQRCVNKLNAEYAFCADAQNYFDGNNEASYLPVPHSLIVEAKAAGNPWASGTALLVNLDYSRDIGVRLPVSA